MARANGAFSKGEKCGYQAGGWPICTACLGRMHQPECTSRKDKTRDCCDARHKMLHEQGQTHGIDDSSIVMWEG
jgi:hypothetical protein